MACLRRALDEGIPITTPRFWRAQQCTDELLRHVFRSATAEPIPLLAERIAVFRESSSILRTVSHTFPMVASKQCILISKVFPGDEDENEVAMGAEEPPEPSQVNISSAQETTEVNGNIGDEYVASDSTQQKNFVQSSMNEHVEALSAEVDNLHIANIGRLDELPEIETPSGEASGIASDEPASQNGLYSSHQPAESSAPVAASSERVPHASDTVLGSEPAPERPTETRPTDHQPDHAVIRLIQKSEQSAGKLVNLLAHHFPCFRDETRFEGRRVRLLKRAQIFVADLWAALKRTGLGEFHDIDHLTMFAGMCANASLRRLCAVLMVALRSC